MIYPATRAVSQSAIVIYGPRRTDSETKAGREVSMLQGGARDRVHCNRTLVSTARIMEQSLVLSKAQRHTCIRRGVRKPSVSEDVSVNLCQIRY